MVCVHHSRMILPRRDSTTTSFCASVAARFDHGRDVPIRKALAGSWQLAQLRRPLPERRLSKNKDRPSAISSLVSRLFFGDGMVSGCEKMLRQTSADAGTEPTVCDRPDDRAASRTSIAVAQRTTAKTLIQLPAVGTITIEQNSIYQIYPRRVDRRRFW